MKKKLISFAAVLTLVMTFIPSALAVNYADFVGSYYTMNSDGEGYAALDIHTCDASSITLDFYRIKNGVVSNTYVFSQGYVQGDAAAIPFTATTSYGATFNGAMKLVFQASGMVKIDIISSLNVNIYNGTLPKRNQSMIPGAASAPAQTGSTAPAATSVPTAQVPQSQEITIPSQPEVNVVLNESKVSFAKGAGPFIYNDRTYVPLRSVFFEMGINVYWDEYQANEILRGQQITCTKNGTIIQLVRTHNDFGANRWTLKKWVDSNTSATDPESIDIIDQQPLIINGTSYLPLRVISEALGAHVNWIGSTRTVDIRCDASNTCWYDKTIISAMEGFTLAEAQSYITDDYSNVVADPTPYFVPESKFYLFSATDMYGAVKLRVYYGGYLDVYPDTETAYTPPAPAEPLPESITVDLSTETAEETPAEPAVETPAETVVIPAETTPTEAPSDTKGGYDEETGVFTFDMTELLDEN